MLRYKVNLCNFAYVIMLSLMWI